MPKKTQANYIKQNILDDLGITECDSFTHEAQINEHVDTLLEYTEMKSASNTAEREVDKQHCRKQLLGLRKELSRQRKDLGLLNKRKRLKEVKDFFPIKNDKRTA